MARRCTERARTPRDTLPPGAADAGAGTFEDRIKAEGEAAARWAQLMQLLEGP